MADQDPNRDLKIEGDVHGDIIIARRHVIYQNLSCEEKVDRRNRQMLLEKVQRFWGEGVLEKSLHGVALLELGMEVLQDSSTIPRYDDKTLRHGVLGSGRTTRKRERIDARL